MQIYDCDVQSGVILRYGRALGGLAVPSDQPEPAVRRELSLNEHRLRRSIVATLHTAADHRCVATIRLNCFEDKSFEQQEWNLVVSSLDKNSSKLFIHRSTRGMYEQ